MISLIANQRLVLKHRSSNNMRSFEFINRLSRSTWHVKRRSTLQYILIPVLRVYALLCFPFLLLLFDLMFTFVRHVIETPSFQSQYTYFNSWMVFESNVFVSMIYYHVSKTFELLPECLQSEITVIWIL
jgi:hypothetical protein